MTDIERIKSDITNAVKDIKFDYNEEWIDYLSFQDYLKENQDAIISYIREEYDIPKDWKLYFDIDALSLVCVPNQNVEYFDIDFYVPSIEIPEIFDKSE